MIGVIWRSLLGLFGLAFLLGGALGLMGWMNGQTARGSGVYGALVPGDSPALATLMVVVGGFMLALLVFILLRRRG